MLQQFKFIMQFVFQLTYFTKNNENGCNTPIDGHFSNRIKEGK